MLIQPFPRVNKRMILKRILEDILGLLSPGLKWAVDHAIGGKTSGWLGVLPLACHHFDLFEVEFRDALALMYHRPLL